MAASASPPEGASTKWAVDAKETSEGPWFCGVARVGPPFPGEWGVAEDGAAEDVVIATTELV